MFTKSGRAKDPSRLAMDAMAKTTLISNNGTSCQLEYLIIMLRLLYSIGLFLSWLDGGD